MNIAVDNVRVASAADATSIAAIYAPYVVGTAVSFEDEPPSATEMADRISSTLQTHPYLVYDGGVLGYAYAGPHAGRAAYRWSCDVSAYVADRCRQRGIGKALYTKLLELLARQGFHSAFAGIALPNEGSVSLHEAIGFVHLGTYREVGFKHGAWHDVGWWRRSLAEGLPPAEPIPFSSLRL